MTVNEAWATAQELLRSMSMEERTAYAFCFQTSRSHQFFFALLRQPSFFNAEGLEKLLEEWTNIENSSEYKETIEERKRRTELQTQPKAELQNLRMERESAPTFDGPSQRNPDPGYPAQLSGRQEVATPPDALCLSPRLHRVPPARRGPHVGICAVRPGTAFLLRQGRGHCKRIAARGQGHPLLRRVLERMHRGHTSGIR